MGGGVFTTSEHSLGEYTFPHSGTDGFSVGKRGREGFLPCLNTLFVNTFPHSGTDRAILLLGVGWGGIFITSEHSLGETPSPTQVLTGLFCCWR